MPGFTVQNWANIKWSDNPQFQREYARITGLFRERTISLIVVIGILFVTFSVLDNWYRFFLALFPLTIASIASGARE